ncbi:hypothetical protein FRC01_005749, partial [Tulasnella sp. 417]
YWQRIIDGCPILWSEVTFEGGLDLLSKSLTNSKDAGLTVKCLLGLGSPSRDSKAMKMVLEHAKRWKSLDITIWIKNYRDVSAYLPLEAGAGGAPILTDMKMYNTVITPETASLISVDAFPRLKSLQLVDVTLGGGFGSLPQLEELSLIDVRCQEAGRFDMEATTAGLPIPKLREVLSSCAANLKALKLHGEFPRTDPSARPNRSRTEEEREKDCEPIAFPNLLRLGIFHCKGETAFRILSNIEAPQCRGLKVYVEELSSPSDQPGALPGWMLGRSAYDEDEDDVDAFSSPTLWTTTVSHVIQKLEPSSFVLEFELQERGFSVRAVNESPNTSTANTNTAGPISADQQPPFIEIVIRPRHTDSDNDQIQSVRPPLHPTPAHHGGDSPLPPSSPASPLSDLPPWATSSGSHHHHRRTHNHNPLFTILKHLVIQASRPEPASVSLTEGECVEENAGGGRLLHVPARLKYKEGKEPSWGEDFLGVLRMVVAAPVGGEGLEGEEKGSGEGEERSQ